MTSYQSSDRIHATVSRRLNPTCGKQLVDFEVPGCSTDDFVCNRSFYLYVPFFLCEDDGMKDDINGSDMDNGSLNVSEKDNLNDSALLEVIDTLPLVFSIHCFGCTYQAMEHWTKIAEEFKFVLVLPVGIQNSWNARYCCGYALEQNVDDYAFLSGIIEFLVSLNSNDSIDGKVDYAKKELSYPFQVSKNYVYAVGWSNGGYMATYAADLFQAVAPISGHQYETSDFPKKETSLFMHHGSDDSLVRPSGCCTDPTMPKCCCGISNYMDQCTGVPDVFERWAKNVNKCGTDENGKVIVSVDRDRKSEITCYTATMECLADTKYCMHGNKQHFNRPSHEKAFPMVNEIANFFANDACVKKGGNWSVTSKSCICQESNNFGGAYCGGNFYSRVVNKASPPSSPEESVTFIAIGSAWLTALSIVVIFGGFAIVKSRRKNDHSGVSKSTYPTN